MSDNPLRHLPAVDTLLNHDSTQPLIDSFGRPLTLNAIRTVLDDVRASLLSQATPKAPSEAMMIDLVQHQLHNWIAPTLRRVINATGVIIHTNLGRAPLSDAAIHAMTEVAGGYSTLEFDLSTGKRGSRSLHAEELLRRITGAEAALVVNNNAAAVLLTLTALAGPTPDRPDERGVIISRGELVEIGGGFRVPDVMAQSGARLIEIGTTNRTHLRDYANAIDDHTALILRAHRSNFAIIGFTTEPRLSEITALAADHAIPVVDDLGSGALLDTSTFGLAPEPLITDSLDAGVAVAMFSGDKLLGGPQAGIIVGQADIVNRLKQHPLARAIRADKLCLAALSATLTHYLKDEALTHIPVWHMISQSQADLTRRAESWANELTTTGLTCEVRDGTSAVGGGSLPGETLPTSTLALKVGSPDKVAAQLRAADVPVIVRIEDDQLILDPRTVLTRDEDLLLSTLKSL